MRRVKNLSNVFEQNPFTKYIQITDRKVSEGCTDEILQVQREVGASKSRLQSSTLCEKSRLVCKVTFLQGVAKVSRQVTLLVLINCLPDWLA